MQNNNCREIHKPVGKEKRSGAFPFLLTDGPDESPYLTWVRHHSNYMALRGPLDFICSLGVLVRGILINLLIITPWLLVIACVISLFYNKMLDYPYFLTRIVVVLGLVSVLLWPVLNAMTNIIVYRRTLEYGSASTVKARDFYERTFGLWLVLIVCALVLDSFPWLLSTYHELLGKSAAPSEQWISGQTELLTSEQAELQASDVDGGTPAGRLSPWLGGISLGSIVAIAAASNKLLSAMGGFRRKFLIAVLGALGLLVPGIAVLFVLDYLIYGDAPEQALLNGINSIVIIGIVLVLAALIIGSIRKTFAAKEAKGAIIILGTLLAMNLAGAALIKHAYDSKASEKTNIHSDSIASAKRLLNFFGTPEKALSIGVEWQNYFTTDKELENAQLTFSRVVREPLEDMVRAELVTPGSFFDALETWDNAETSAEIKEETSPASGETKQAVEKEHIGLVPLADIYATIVGGYYYHLDKEKTQRIELDLSLPSTRELLTVNLRDELATKDEAIYPTFKLYHSAFLSGLDKFKLKYPQLLSDISSVLDSNNELQYVLNDRPPAKRNEVGISTNDAVQDMRKPVALENNELLYDSLDSREINREIQKQSREHYFSLRALFVIAVAMVLWAYCWFVVDVNRTSIHAMYRDRLASTFLIGIDPKGDIGVEHDIDLEDINAYVAGSTAPYHLINAALNLQGSNDIGVRNRQCGFFILSKRFTGSMRTGYCRSEVMEQAFPQMSLATAMAISAAAASPNMGRSTNAGLVAFMTMLNIRLGIWIPNPGRVEERLYKFQWPKRKQHDKNLTKTELEAQIDRRTSKHGFRFEEVFEEELKEIEQRWEQAYEDPGERDFLVTTNSPSVDRNLFGIALSGGGIRSATINLGITQALQKSGVFRHIDFMSTVSGGGYLGSSISTLMRTNTRRHSGINGTVSIDKQADGQHVVTVRSTDSTEERRYVFSKHATLAVENGDFIKAGKRLLLRPGAPQCSPTDGVATVEKNETTGTQVVTITSEDASRTQLTFSRFDELKVRSGDTVATGDALTIQHNTFADRFRWRVRPAALLQEVFSKLDSRSRWVNLSDGGHIENLAIFELLRRRCRFIIVGDGEEDPMMHFGGLATLIRTARIDLGIEISIDLEDISLDHYYGLSQQHWSIARIHYPNDKSEGILLYLKSSVTGDEDASISEYRHRNPTFPHESTADQFFVEDQFEAYRALGQHIADDVLQHLPSYDQHLEKTSNTSSVNATVETDTLTFDACERWFFKLMEVCEDRKQELGKAPTRVVVEEINEYAAEGIRPEATVNQAAYQRTSERSTVLDSLTDPD